MRSFWRKTLRNETITQLSDLERLRFNVSMDFKEWLKTFYLQFFSLNVLKFHLHLLKQNIFRALKRDLERAYLMIAGQSWHFTSCCWRCNLCTAIFYRCMRSMNSQEEWLLTFYAFKFCSPAVFKYKRIFCELYIMRNIKTESRILSKTWLCISVVCGSILLILSYLSFPEIYF